MCPKIDLFFSLHTKYTTNFEKMKFELSTDHRAAKPNTISAVTFVGCIEVEQESFVVFCSTRVNPSLHHSNCRVYARLHRLQHFLSWYYCRLRVHKIFPKIGIADCRPAYIEIDL